MSELQEHHEITPGSEKSFGLVFSVVFALIGLYPLLSDGQVIIWVLAVSAGFFLIAFIAPGILAIPNKLWFKFGMLLSFIVTPVVMAVIFFLVLTPFGLLMRLFSRNPEDRKLAPKAESYWQVRDDENNPMGSMKNQF